MERIAGAARDIRPAAAHLAIQHQGHYRPF